jgi:hypothetical protein
MENVPQGLKICPKIGKYGKCAQFFFENFEKYFQYIVTLGFYSNVKGVITMETVFA